MTCDVAIIGGGRGMRNLGIIRQGYPHFFGNLLLQGAGIKWDLGLKDFVTFLDEALHKF
ncbi:hypothetical protein [Lentibacillus sediminis]|uniref:hypothetical protein n=1 Tax=Lentibacillus sediminis TaxID=1940529 RepID=UPI001304154B|nr:hypothetical protein [Lentibacillus sediminis]